MALLKAFKKLLPTPKRKQSFVVSAWEAAGHGKRLKNWNASSSSINDLLDANLETLRSRSRHVVMNNPIAGNAINSIVSNCIGTGIKPQSKAPDESFRTEVQELWLEWTQEADTHGVTDFYGLQSLICQSMLEGGSCFVRFRSRRPEDGLSVPLQLQAIESEHLNRSLNRTLPNGGVIKNGIEFNPIGQRAAYHLYRQHPGENFGFSNIDSVRVPASEVMHIFRPLRLGQIDGVPWLSNVLLKLHELDKYDDAEIIRKQTAAMFAGFITRLDPEDMVLNQSQDDDNAGGDGFESPIELVPGMMQFLEPGEDIKFSEPADVGANYESFMRTQLRFVAMGMGLSYEQLTGDLTQVNYSSIRAGLLEFRRKCEMLQRHVIVHQFCRPVWQRWFQLALLSGGLESKTDDRKSRSVKWIAQGWDWVDPLKDQQAQQMAVRNGFKSRSQVVSGLGYDAEEIDREIEADNKRADDKNLVYDSDGRASKAQSHSNKESE